MKFSAIEELIDGTLEKKLESGMPTNKIRLERIGKTYETLESTLFEKQRKMLENLYFELSGEIGERERDFFKLGFRYGMLCAMESVFYPTDYEGDSVHKNEPFYYDIDKETK